MNGFKVSRDDVRQVFRRGEIDRTTARFLLVAGFKMTQAQADAFLDR